MQRHGQCSEPVTLPEHQALNNSSHLRTFPWRDLPIIILADVLVRLGTSYCGGPWAAARMPVATHPLQGAIAEREPGAAAETASAWLGGVVPWRLGTARWSRRRLQVAVSATRPRPRPTTRILLRVVRCPLDFHLLLYVSLDFRLLLVVPYTVRTLFGARVVLVLVELLELALQFHRVEVWLLVLRWEHTT